MFEKVNMEGKTNMDESFSLTISFMESTWQLAEQFRCINVELMEPAKLIERDSDLMDKERVKYYRMQKREYNRKIERARPCLLPDSVHAKIMDMLREQGSVSARLLHRIRDRVQRWYCDVDYACAQVVNFGNLNTKEVVCEVVERDITKLDIQFIDKLGNVIECTTQIPVVMRELPTQLQPGNTFNNEAGKEAFGNIYSLALFSNIDVNPRPDENNKGA